MRACPQGRGRSVDRGTRGSGIEPRNTSLQQELRGIPGCRGCQSKPKATLALPHWRGSAGPRAVRDPVHARKHLAREPGDPATFCGALGSACRRAHREAFGCTTMSQGRGKSDCCVVPKKPSNKAVGASPAVAEAVEGRRQAKGNALAARMSRRTIRAYDVGTALDGIRRTARRTPASASLRPKAGAVCGNSARTDLWRGCRVTGIPTPTVESSLARTGALATRRCGACVTTLGEAGRSGRAGVHAAPIFDTENTE